MEVAGAGAECGEEIAAVKPHCIDVGPKCARSSLDLIDTRIVIKSK